MQTDFPDILISTTSGLQEQCIGEDQGETSGHEGLADAFQYMRQLAIDSIMYICQFLL